MDQQSNSACTITVITIDQHRRLLIALRYVAHHKNNKASKESIKAIELDHSEPIGVITTNGIATNAHAATGNIEDPKQLQIALRRVLKSLKGLRYVVKSVDQLKFVRATLRECIDSLAD